MCYLKQHGSFAGMPMLQGRAENGPIPPITLINGRRYTGLSVDEPPAPQTSHQATQITIPRNESVSVFVRNKFDEMNAPRHRYSRHFMEIDFGKNDIQPMLLNTSADDEVDDDSRYQTYPYSKSSQRNQLLSNIRKASKANPPPTVMEFFIGENQ